MSSTAPAADHVNLTSERAGLLARLPFVTGLLTRLVVKQRVAPKRLENVKSPADYGLEFRSVDVRSSDGVRLSAWEIPAPGSTKVAIVNHPLLCTRYGSVDGMDGVPVEFLPMIGHLHQAGYSVITYDQRGQGESDGGLGKSSKGVEAAVGAGSVEWQDFVGVLRHVRDHPEFGDNDIALVTHCMGANAALGAWQHAPDEFDLDKVKCHVLVQPTISYNMMARLTRQKLRIDLASSVEQATREQHGFGFADALSSIEHVRVPVLFAQVAADAYTTDEGTGVNDVQVIHDRCPTPKELIWIGPDQQEAFGTGKRFDGYNYFNHHPEGLLDFLERNMA